MQKPLELKVDFAAMAGYLRYQPLKNETHVARTQRISDDVFVDFNARRRFWVLSYWRSTTSRSTSPVDSLRSMTLSFPSYSFRVTRRVASRSGSQGSLPQAGLWAERLTTMRMPSGSRISVPTVLVEIGW